MVRRAVRMTIVLVVILVVIISARVPAAEAQTWSSWSCKATVSNYPVSGGSISGRGCASLWTGSQLLWQVWADTYTPYSVSIYTYVAGLDQCGMGGWVLQMRKDNYDSNATYGTTGGSVQGSYQNCTNGHTYRVNASHYRQATAGSAWEGSNGDAYY